MSRSTVRSASDKHQVDSKRSTKYGLRAGTSVNTSLENGDLIPREKIMNNLDIVNEHMEMFITDIDSRLGFLKNSASPDVETPRNSRRIVPPINHKEYRSSSQEPIISYQPVLNQFLSKVMPDIDTPEVKRKLSVDRTRAETIRNRAKAKTSSREYIFFKRTKSRISKRSNKGPPSLRETHQELKLPGIEDTLNRFAIKQDIFLAYRNGDKASFSGDPDSDPTVRYSTTCIEQGVPPLPILSYIQDQQLVLNMYSLSNKYCKAFGMSACSLYDLQHVYLDDNYISDEGGSEILKGFAVQGMIRTLYYTRNEIGVKFAEQFENLVDNSKHLIDINFRGCKYNFHAMCNLFDHIAKIPIVRKCILADLSLSDHLIDKLCKAFTYKKIIELDLSYNSISYHGSCIFWSSLKKLKYTKYLDYSWNDLRSPKYELSNMIYSGILSHRRIMHINLAYTKLDSTDLDIILRSAKESQTLIGLHLCANKFSEGQIESTIATLGGRSYETYYANSAYFIEYPLKTSSNKSHLPKLTPRDKYEIKAITSKSRFPNLKMKDQCGKILTSHRDVPLNKFKASRSVDIQTYEENSPQIFTRFIGAGSAELKDAAMWRHTTQCWICEKWEPQKISVRIPNLVKQLNVSYCINRDGDKGKVLLKGSFNNWLEIEMKQSDEIDDQYEVKVLLPPGKHYFWVIYQDYLCIDKKTASKYWIQSRVNEINLAIRSKEINISKARRAKPPPRVFSKNNSVFKHFLDSTDEIKKIMLDNDMKYAKLNKLIKDENDIKEITRVLYENYSEIKEIFDYYASESMYPTIGMIDFGKFCEKCNLLDNYHMNIGAVDTIFKSANYEVVDLEDNPDNSLCRYEFFEVLVRLALHKFKDETSTAFEKFNKLLNDYIMPNAMASKASSFRKEKLYNLEVNDLLEANLSALQTVRNILAF